MNPIQTQKERESRLEEICSEILGNSRNELYLHMRFLDVSLSSLRFTPSQQIEPAGTDGVCLFYHPDLLASLYRKGRVLINRMYLHTVLHCLFAHLYRRKGRDEEYWRLACDMTVEYIMDGLSQKCLHRHRSLFRREWYQRMKENGGVVTAERVYRMLCQLHLPQPAIEELSREFYADDHRFWPKEPEKEAKQEQQQRWEEISEKMQTEMETFSKEASEESKSLVEQVQIQNRERYDYREFLRKFCVLKEEMTVDQDSFDYIFYHYGMKVYGNMPLIEPLETKEEYRVEDFVIVIDTSMSCRGELVMHFLEETYGILSQSESFFRKINLHILQCDERVQEDRVITNGREMKAYLEQFTIVGGGGTDFRPAFSYVEELLKRGAFSRLRGLLYFTDGYGTFPVRKPAYETAFVFMKEDYRDVDVPNWAIKLIIDPEEEECHHEY